MIMVQCLTPTKVHKEKCEWGPKYFRDMCRRMWLSVTKSFYSETKISKLESNDSAMFLNKTNEVLDMVCGIPQSVLINISLCVFFKIYLFIFYLFIFSSSGFKFQTKPQSVCYNPEFSPAKVSSHESEIWGESPSCEQKRQRE